MNVPAKRQISAWLLLSVYLPMLLLSSLHIHDSGVEREATCHECVQHQCHGHLSQFSGDLHQCVLCQILTLTYVATAAGAMLFLLPKRLVGYARFSQATCLRSCHSVRLRGPPSA